MKTRRVPIVLAVAAFLVGLLFILLPGLDLAVAELFYVGQNKFAGQTSLGEAARRLAYWVPTASLVAGLGFYVARHFKWWRGAAPTGRATIVLVLSFALGPGLLANTLLKDHSHRPRPYQTVDFGGDDAFRPFYKFDGACARNCSFVSGEGAAAFWTITPALMLPSPWGAPAVAGSLVFAVAVGTLRMAFGGHYLSDTIFAALFTWLVVWATWRLLLVNRRAWQSALWMPATRSSEAIDASIDGDVLQENSGTPRPWT